MSGLVPAAKVAMIETEPSELDWTRNQKIIQAGELLLDHLGHGILHGRGIGAGIEGIHRHRRWRDGGILLHRQGEGRNGACQHDDDGDDPGEDRPVDEEAR